MRLGHEKNNPKSVNNPPSNRRARLVWLLLVVVLLVATLVAAPALNTVTHPAEDAAMLMRYAAHLAQGHGIVWNIGEKPVDGATDFLFMLLLAGLHALGIPLESAVLGVGTAAHLLAVALVFDTVARIEPRHPWLAAFSALLLALGPGTAYTTAYFGTTTFALAGALTWRLATRLALCAQPPRRLTLAFAVASLLTGLIRPEGVFLVVLILLGLLVRREGRGARVILRDFALVFGGLGLAYFIWRWAYFGYPLPNPYYKKGAGELHPGGLWNAFRNLVELNQPYIWLVLGALVAILVKWLPSLKANQFTLQVKVTNLRRVLFAGSTLAVLAVGAGLLRRSQPQPEMLFGLYSRNYFILLCAGLVLALALLALALTLPRWLPDPLRLPWFSSRLSGAARVRALKAAFLLIPVVGFTLIWILLSNEMNYLGRFQYPLMPLILMGAPALWLEAKAALVERSPRLVKAARFAEWVAVLGGILLTLSISSAPTYPDGRYDVAVYLRQYAAKGYTIATSEAGLLPFYSTWRAVDTWGLNDQWIAHTGEVKDAYLDRYRPELIVFHANLRFTERDPETGWDWMARAVWSYARKRGYTLAAAFGSNHDDYHYYFVRPDFADAPAIIAHLREMDYAWYKNGRKAVNHAPDLLDE